MLRLIFNSIKDPDFFFATHIHATDPTFYIENGSGKYAFLDSREYDVAKAEAKAGIEVVLFDKYLTINPKNDFGLQLSPVQKQLLALLEDYGNGEKTINVPASFSLPMADFLRSVGYAIEIVEPFFPGRLCKDQYAVDSIKDAIKRTEGVFLYMQEILKNSTIEGDKVYYQGEVLTSEFLKTEAELFLLKRDLELCDGLIIASGSQASIPHHRGSGPILPHSTIIFDIFPRCRKTGYYADITRTYFKGQPSDEVRKMYETVLAVQESQVEMIRPGIPNIDIHNKGCQMFVDAGYQVGKEGFSHGTGHGLGVELHEAPRINNRTDEILEIGNVVTVEPGLYYERLGGVRIEDNILVTHDGYENLVTLDKGLLVF